jgi:hypothetical protein
MTQARRQLVNSSQAHVSLHPALRSTVSALRLLLPPGKLDAKSLYCGTILSNCERLRGFGGGDEHFSTHVTALLRAR